MKKYLIPIGMLVGGIIGLIIGLIIDFAVTAVMFAGGAAGTVVGAAAQLVINQRYPDEYFVRKRTKEEISASLFSESDIAFREAFGASKVFRTDRAEEDVDIEDYLGEGENNRQKRLLQDQRWERQAQLAKERRAVNPGSVKSAQAYPENGDSKSKSRERSGRSNGTPVRNTQSRNAQMKNIQEKNTRVRTAQTKNTQTKKHVVVEEED